MGMRATIHFRYVGEEKPEAIVYRHWDGSLDGVGKDLCRFLDDVEKQCKYTRFDDPMYLAAKYVIWQAGKYECAPLDVMGLGIVQEDPCDIAFRYTLYCSEIRNVRPLVHVEDISLKKKMFLHAASAESGDGRKNQRG